MVETSSVCSSFTGTKEEVRQRSMEKWKVSIGQRSGMDGRIEQGQDFQSGDSCCMLPVWIQKLAISYFHLLVTDAVNKGSKSGHIQPLPL